MKRKTIVAIAIVLVIGICAVIGVNILANDSEYPGEVRFCVPYDEDNAVVVYNKLVREDKLAAPVNEVTVALYNIYSNKKELIYQGTNLYKSGNDQLLTAENTIIYKSVDEIWTFTKDGGEWQYSTTPLAIIRTVSPDNSNYAEKNEGSIILREQASREKLAEIALGDIREILYRPDGAQIAIAFADNSAIALWDWQEDKVQKLYIGQELPQVANWVDIVDMSYSADGRYLLINFLCENGNCIVIWDCQNNEPVDEIYFEQEVNVLDVSDTQILWAKNANKNEHYLELYNWQTHERAELDNSADYYTAGCFMPSTDGEMHIVVNKFDGNEQESILKVFDKGNGYIATKHEVKKINRLRKFLRTII